MSEYREQKFCQCCNKMVLATKPKPNHILHLILSCITCVWFIAWIIITISAQSASYRCNNCGSAL